MATATLVREAMARFRSRIEARIADGNLSLEQLVDMVVEQEGAAMMRATDAQVEEQLADWAADTGEEEVVDPLGFQSGPR
jgi:hypothetical protein